MDGLNFRSNDFSIGSMQNNLLAVGGAAALGITITFVKRKYFNKTNSQDSLPGAQLQDNALISLGAVKNDIKGYLGPNNVDEILGDPLRALVYSIALKVVGLFIGLIFTSLGSVIFFLSIYRIDAEIWNNGQEYYNVLSQRVSPRSFISNMWQQLTGRVGAGGQANQQQPQQQAQGQ